MSNCDLTSSLPDHRANVLTQPIFSRSGWAWRMLGGKKKAKDYPHLSHLHSKRNNSLNNSFTHLTNIVLEGKSLTFIDHDTF